MRFDDYLINEQDYTPIQLDAAKIYTTLSKDCKMFLKEFEKTEQPVPKGSKSIPSSYRWLLRGTYKSTDKIKKVTPRSDRQPKDTPPELHKLLDWEFKRRFGWYARSEGVFVTGYYQDAKAYGTAIYMVFPIGRYDYIWSPKVKDLYEEFESQGYLHWFEEGDPLDFLDDIWLDWEDLYGSESKGGHWQISTFELDSRRLEDAIKEVDKLVDAGEITSKDLDVRIEWVPDVSKEVYIEKRKKEYEKQIQNDLDKWLSTYRGKGNLKGAINSGSEIMLRCDSYYIVNMNYDVELAKMIWGTK